MLESSYSICHAVKPLSAGWKSSATVQAAPAGRGAAAAATSAAAANGSSSWQQQLISSSSSDYPPAAAAGPWGPAATLAKTAAAAARAGAAAPTAAAAVKESSRNNHISNSNSKSSSSSNRSSSNSSSNSSSSNSNSRSSKAAAAAGTATATMGNRKKRRGLNGLFEKLRADSRGSKPSQAAAGEGEQTINPKPQILNPKPQILDKQQTAKPQSPLSFPEAVALDCEMVGCGPDGSISVLAQVALVDEQGQTLVNELVKPQLPVTDLRAHVTGLDMWSLENRGISFAAAKSLISEKIKGKILVGHAIHHDLQVLDLTHPLHLLRDTSRYRPLRPSFLHASSSPSLRLLVKHHFKRSIQSGSHDPTEDAREAMNLYLLVKQQWNARFAAAAAAAAAAPDATDDPLRPAAEAADVECLLQQMEQQQRQKLREQEQQLLLQQEQQQGKKKKRKRKEPHEYFLD
ncbi:hypothetical protein Efla_000329 [Eimeria flavescens]